MEETMHSRKLAIRVANRHLEAGVSEWVKWIVQPFEVLLRRSNEFVNGPIDDAMDNVFRDLAPAIVATIGEREVDADVEEFVEGAAHGRHDSLGGFFADDDPRWTNDYQNGYSWGFENAQTWKGGALPSSVRSQVVRDNVKEFRGELTEQLVKEALGKAWHTVDPRETVKHMLAAVKKHGWKVGIGFALFEILEHTVLPAALIALTGRPEMAITGTLPIGEILLPLILRSLGNVPGAINEANTAGHLDWYLENFGSIRLGHTNGTSRASIKTEASQFRLASSIKGSDSNARTLTAQDRASLIRLASTLPAGSAERKAILAGLGKAAEAGRVGAKQPSLADLREAQHKARRDAMDDNPVISAAGQAELKRLRMLIDNHPEELDAQHDRRVKDDARFMRMWE